MQSCVCVCVCMCVGACVCMRMSVSACLCICVCVCVPEQTDERGAGEQCDERQAVAHSGQDTHHFVEDQLDTDTQKRLMTALIRNDENICQS